MICFMCLFSVTSILSVIQQHRFWWLMCLALFFCVLEYLVRLYDIWGESEREGGREGGRETVGDHKSPSWNPIPTLHSEAAKIEPYLRITPLYRPLLLVPFVPSSSFIIVEFVDSSTTSSSLVVKTKKNPQCAVVVVNTECILYSRFRILPILLNPTKTTHSDWCSD